MMDFSSVCRTCLSGDSLNQIFMNPEFYERYSTAVFIATGLKVKPNDGLPQKMCTSCVNCLNESLKFRKLSRETENKLLTLKNQIDHNYYCRTEETSDCNHFNINNDVSLAIDDRKDINPYIETYIEVPVVNTDRIDLQLNSTQTVNIDDSDLNYKLNDETSDEAKTYLKIESKEIELVEVKNVKEVEGESDVKAEYTDNEVLEDVDDTPLKYLIEDHDGENAFNGDTDEHFNKKGKKRKINAGGAPYIPFIDTTDSNKATCRLCEKALSYRSVSSHMLTRHPGTGGLTVLCELCDTYVMKDTVRRHEVTVHGPSGDKCAHCKAVFDGRATLISHAPLCTGKKKKRKACESGRELVECDICHKKMQKASLRMHKRIKHAGLGPVCEHCGKRFGNQFRLTEHCRSKHGYDKFKCSYCDFQSASVMSLRNHERRHRGEKPFVCELCGAKFHAAYLLAQHRQSHRAQKLVKCDLCPASFKANNSLHMHKMTCHSTSLYKCVLCARAYSCRHYVVKHLRQVHAYRGRVPTLQKIDPGAQSKE